MPAEHDRRSPGQAGDRPHPDFYDFAQEFLRRNPDYRCDHARLLRRIGNDGRDERWRAFCAQWGLAFPAGSLPFGR